MTNTPDTPAEQSRPDKCNSCYYKKGCMLTPGMAKKCLGPYKDAKHHLKVYDAEIKDKSKFKE